MKALLLGTLVAAVLVSGADARPQIRPPHPDAEATLAPLRKAATDCFAETVLSNPAATRFAREGQWYRAAGVTGFLCRPEVDAMVQAQDVLFGRGAGERYFKGAYAKHLEHELAERLQPMLERKAVASAEPAPEKASVEDAAGN